MFTGAAAGLLGLCCTAILIRGLPGALADILAEGVVRAILEYPANTRSEGRVVRAARAAR